MKENVQQMGKARGKEDLQYFVAQYSNSSDLTATENQCNVVWKSTFNFLQVPRSELSSESEGSMEAFSIHRDSLAAIQILSRNKKQLNETITVDQFDTLLNIANIGRTNKEDINQDINDSAIVVEALKCLYNLVYESNNCRIICLKSEAINGIVRRLRTYISTSISIYRDKNLTWDMQYFDMKLLFLITAIDPDGRTKVRDDQNGLICLTSLQNRPQELNDRQVNLVIEIMKVLFNFTSVATEKIGDIQFRGLAVVLHDLLLLRAASEEKHIELWSNTINLLTTVPTACYSELVIPMHIHVDSLVNGINWGQKISAIRCDIEMFGNTVKHNAETIEDDRNGTI
ncbi:synembryn-like [Sitodiplosis mosellana]|uniref:synembryn-like n=1 Tax=Sitodiplosis mosellana TaxID=263140 RepID=UPI00244507E3|nr:synembryn-like [Sitodiplosis mosellana]